MENYDGFSEENLRDISRLKAKVRSGYRMFLFDSFKATTEEEIETNKDALWDTPKKLF
jgi:hypothetical protein